MINPCSSEPISASCVAPQRASCATDDGLWAVVVAAGRGERFGDSRGKQFVEVAGKPLATWSLMAFDAYAELSGLVLVCPPERLEEARTYLVEPFAFAHEVTCVPGGATRQESCWSGLCAVPAQARFVAVHDGARPLITPALIGQLHKALRANKSLAGVIAARPATDTLKVVDGRDIVGTPDRSMYWYAETPQVFRAEPLRAAYAQAFAEDVAGTDDASLVERAGGRVVCVPVETDNVKVTQPEDIVRAEAVLVRRA